jgi:hypothetical protein
MNEIMAAIIPTWSLEAQANRRAPLQSLNGENIIRKSFQNLENNWSEKHAFISIKKKEHES